MTQIAFPSQISARSARAASKTYNLHRGKPPQEHVVQGIACYRMPCGNVRMCKDLYRPHYPEGSTPGLGTVHLRMRRTPQGRTTYEASVAQFQTAAEIMGCEKSSSVNNPLEVVPSVRTPVSYSSGSLRAELVQPDDPFSPISSLKIDPYDQARKNIERCNRRSLHDIEV
ncbi:hypothetical protein LCGC14_0043110 [marine sediment metagenome]|jgi:hypothetical protein|uniref:Uncharacterized protein n=1 Tax=marine sediment metagenome TaxID=412755 RepID=A0A0F9W7W8_9ZZZZ